MAVHYKSRDARARKKGGRKLAPGDRFYLFNKEGRDSNFTNVAGGIGLTSFVTHVYVEGEPGQSVDAFLEWINAKGKTQSQHYVGSIDIGPRGFTYANIPALFPLAPGDAVAAVLQGPSSNTGAVTINLFDVDAGLLK